MGRKSTRAKEKKLKKKEEGARMAAKIALVDAANAQDDPMATLLPFKTFQRNGLHVSISCYRVRDLDSETVDWAFQLTKDNMQTLYESSEFGWSDKQKREEMCEDRAWYLIARDVNNNNTPVALVHFRYDLESDDEVLYCYEVQLCKEMRRKGLGKFLVQILELLAFKSQMKKVMMTVFKHNLAAQEFFINKLKYEIDETSPEDSMVDAMFDDEGQSSTYQIISKRIGARREIGVPQTAPKSTSRVAMHTGAAMTTCGGHCCHH